VSPNIKDIVATTLALARGLVSMCLGVVAVVVRVAAALRSARVFWDSTVGRSLVTVAVGASAVLVAVMDMASLHREAVGSVVPRLNPQ
jgi:hypothetical protein